MNFQTQIDENKKTTITWKDATIVVVLLTGLIYFITYAFRQGFTNYYQLGEIARNSIEPADISQAFTWIFTYMTGPVLIYFILTAILVIAGDVAIFLINPIAITVIVVPIFNIINNRDSGENLWQSVIVVIILAVLKKLMEYERFNHWPLLPKIRDYFINDARTISKVWKRLAYLKFMILSLILLLIFLASYDLGNKVAKDKESYLIINKDKNTTYVVLEENEGNLIIARLNKKAKTIEPKYSIIEKKSNIKKPLILERITVDGGLEVK
ncbi:hypothetical protein [Priestia megaterium]|uniref:hypothetical protein n=1 Tax=Priestia megaterium TaxID=1404 RepID=UPI000BFC1DA1|nr:hypothetical protein [Priestia megaterium]PGT77452.1 hypothetical protein COD15_01645 [Priestia megaterium]